MPLRTLLLLFLSALYNFLAVIPNIWRGRYELP